MLAISMAGWVASLKVLSFAVFYRTRLYEKHLSEWFVFELKQFRPDGELSPCEEQRFLNAAVTYFRSVGADLVIPASTNTIFRTVPEGAIVAPYGSYIVDLTETEETRWNRLHSKHRNAVRNARKNGVQIKDGSEYMDAAYEIGAGTLQRSQMGFLSMDSFRRLFGALSENISVFIAEYRGSLARLCGNPI